MSNERERLLQTHAEILGQDADERLMRLVRDLDAMSSLGEAPAHLVDRMDRLLEQPATAPAAQGQVSSVSLVRTRDAEGRVRRRPPPILRFLHRFAEFGVITAPFLLLFLLAAALTRGVWWDRQGVGSVVSTPEPVIIVFNHGRTIQVQPGSDQYTILAAAAKQVLRELPGQGRTCECRLERRHARSTSDGFEVAYPEPGIQTPNHGPYRSIMIAVHGSTYSDGWGEVYLDSGGGYSRQAPMSVHAGSPEDLQRVDAVRIALGLEPLVPDAE